MKGRSFNQGGKPCGRRVDLWGGTKNPKVCQSAFVRKEKFERREAGLNGQDVGGGAHEAVGHPSLDLVPKRGELPGHVDCGREGVRTIAEDGKEERRGKPMAEKGGESDPWRGESFDGHERRLGFGYPFDEVGGSGDRGREPVA